jgi:hypothetical protein
MKKFGKLFALACVIAWTIGVTQLYAQSTKSLDGVQYTVIDPVTFAFNVETKKVKVGETYVIDGQVLLTSGATLNLRDAGAMNDFVLSSPMKLDYGTRVTVYAKIAEVTVLGVKSNIVKIEGAWIPSDAATTAISTKTLDGVQYTVIDPVTFAFNVETKKVKVGETYVIDGQVLLTSGATLNLKDAGAMNDFVLSSPMKLDYGTRVTVYAKIAEVTVLGVKSNIVKIERK